MIYVYNYNKYKMPFITDEQIHNVIDYNINKMQNTGMSDIEMWNIISKISILLSSDNFIITEEKINIMQDSGIII
jgi:hypothetical protein